MPSHGERGTGERSCVSPDKTSPTVTTSAHSSNRATSASSRGKSRNERWQEQDPVNFHKEEALRKQAARTRMSGIEGVAAGNNHGGRRVSATEAFMSRLEGNRGPQNRRDSIVMFEKMLEDCSTNNSAYLRDVCVSVKRSSTTCVPGTQEQAAVKDRANVASTTLARRKQARHARARIMSSSQGSYMIGKDKEKVLLGGEQMKPEAQRELKVES